MKHEIDNHTPRLARWILKSCLGQDDSSHRLGDFEEVYRFIAAENGRGRAWSWYWLMVLRSVPLFIGCSIIWSAAMLKNYMKITFRNVNRQKIYALINVLGLAIGMSAAMMILLWVRDEHIYDRFHANADRIYRAYQVFHYGDYHLEQTQSPAVLAVKLREECPEVEMVTRVRGYRDEYLVTAGDRKFNERGLGIADEYFFQLFSFPLLAGDRSTILSEPNTVAISEKAAMKYFGSSDAVGRVLTIFEEDFKVTGVFKNMPHQSHFHMDVLFSLVSVERYQRVEWGMNVFKTYVLLRKGGSVESLEAKLTDLVKYHMFNSPEQYESVIEKGNYTKFPLQRLTDIHLDSHLLWEFETNGNRTYVHFFTIIAVFILLIAAVNYMNLSTARSAGRAREVGIRKTVGSTRASLAHRFLTESILTSLLALVLSLGALHALMPFFRNLVGKPWLQIPYVAHPFLLVPLIILAVMIGIFAGVYPALFLASFKPVAVLSGRQSHGMRRSRLRNGLVVFQFLLSILLLASTLIVKSQMDFIQSRNLGYEQEQVVVLQTYEALGEKLSVLKDALITNPSVVSVSASSSVPGTGFTNIGMGLEGSNTSRGTNLYLTDADFLETMEMEMAEGRFFEESITADGQAVVLNESMARELAEENLLGKRMMIWVGGEGQEPFHIIGIVKDFHYESFHEPVKPMVMIKLYGTCPWLESYVSIRIRTADIRGVLAFLRETWEEVLPTTPFEYSFLDSIYADQYQNEVRTSRVFTIFTVFALFVASLGLLGLASFAAEQRKKEISIRKALGADTIRIIVMLSKDFQKLILIANLVAWPLAYFLMKQWLQSFSYRTNIGLWIFAVSGLLAFLIAILAVLYHSLKAATANPVDSLKYE